MSVDETIDELTERSSLTRRQAEAFVLRDVEAVPRQAAAESMGISPNVLDKHLRAARDKVEAAKETTRAVDAARHEELPVECADCGSTLGGTWATDDDGRALCGDCAGVDLSAALGPDF